MKKVLHNCGFILELQDRYGWGKRLSGIGQRLADLGHKIPLTGLIF